MHNKRYNPDVVIDFGVDFSNDYNKSKNKFFDRYIIFNKDFMKYIFKLALRALIMIGIIELSYFISLGGFYLVSNDPIYFRNLSIFHARGVEFATECSDIISIFCSIAFVLFCIYDVGKYYVTKCKSSKRYQ
ncbi:hypothetical protein [Acanthamoeba castellanii mimivirus]|uniref:Uncharacterized protein L801 n=5 Tax=Mimivirus TaxID=315393 RepID=YL801_MIMIV|nr:hypothetical protein MIMI_gp0864 [Acanthamoeba polyphaga mimivirus]Q5UR61.1 RecName: Full=Uncharacterized protein L801 [Acanthamoeba polyphaga mimivirus]AEQ61016.1 hypothetical protein [Acanthamoeba castellanii mamavirus]AHA45027.1 hypothetical protein HIRU_S121 [Hirudovirus strain Sangsue]AHJ40389.1 hypothetical protein [Samba virus]ALR84449.1 hypothetical protein [Niemeyer virus]AMZ03243.1 hypothetical protein [Mimivirus Bombay]EJN40560.1 hypothetical protein lvs_L702 [Acanthamoeba poly